MSTPKSRIAFFIAVPLLIALLPIAVYLADSAVSSSEVPRNVAIVGIPVGGLSEEDAIAVIEAYGTELAATPAAFTVAGTTYQLVPRTIGLNVGAEQAVAEAMAVRPTGLIDAFTWWLRSFNTNVEVALSTEVDPEALTVTLEEWEREAIVEKAYNGSVVIADGELSFDYPRIGKAIDYEASAATITAAVGTPERSTQVLALTDDIPVLTEHDIDAAVAEIRSLTDAPVTLYNDELNYFFTFEPGHIARAIQVEFVENSPITIEISLNEQMIASLVEPRRGEFELPPLNASFDVDVETDTVTIIPSRGGTIFDPDGLATELYAAASSNDFGRFPVTTGDEPEFSTVDAEGFGPLELVSTFTTRMPGVNRVHNIKLMADTIDGYVVWPGEEFSINEVIGQRTLAKGYKRDGAIIDGEVFCCDHPANVGGGVSQYGTTFYNTVFFGCYEDIEHSPHSLYISRYPEGREATLGFPKPDVRFRNDSASPVIIKNTYTNNEITVTFYGNTGDRECTAEKGERFNTSSARVRYEANPGVAPGTEVVVSKGSSGWSVTVTRTITHGNGFIERQPFTHRYRGHLRKIAVHPCDMAGSNVECPIAVPAVVGQAQVTAEAALLGAGFEVAVSIAETPDPLEDGIVISQSPRGGSFADEGAAITITVGNYVDPGDGGDG